MWLLNARTERLESFVDERAVKYAILSHTWGEEEVTFQDMQGVDPTRKKEYWKIQLTCQQALKDGLHYAWADTCCINKESSAELSEAINSMFHERSTVCYVFLEDVELEERMDCTDHPNPDTLQSIGQARWFTRGWTLQELIAPSVVLFFDRLWQMLGTRDELSGFLSNLTKIDSSILSRRSTSLQLDLFSVATRMSWAAKRSTTRLEDRAYCLLGIFDVNLPLLYGEGEKAFQRLQEEIVGRTEDQSIFAWQCLEYPGNECALFAASPDDFVLAAPVVRWINGPVSSMRLSHQGLEINLPILKLDSGNEFEADRYYAVLNCHYEDDLTGPLALSVIRHKPQQGQRGRRNEYYVTSHMQNPETPTQRLTRISRHTLEGAPTETLFLQPRFSRHDHSKHRQNLRGFNTLFRQYASPECVLVEVVQNPEYSFQLLESEPTGSWSSSGLFMMPDSERTIGWRSWRVTHIQRPATSWKLCLVLARASELVSGRPAGYLPDPETRQYLQVRLEISRTDGYFDQRRSSTFKPAFGNCFTGPQVYGADGRTTRQVQSSCKLKVHDTAGFWCRATATANGMAMGRPVHMVEVSAHKPKWEADRLLLNEAQKPSREDSAQVPPIGLPLPPLRSSFGT